MERQEAKQASDAEINQKLKDKKQEARINKAPPPVGGAEPLQAPLGPETTLSAEVPVKDSAERKPGRTRIKGGEKWDMNTGKEAAMVVDKEGMTKEEKKKTKEDHDVEMELNSILKKGPSKLLVVIWKGCALTLISQSSFSQNRTAPTRERPKIFCSTSTPSRRRLMLSSWMSIH